MSIDARFRTTEYLIEVSDFGHLALWEKWSAQSLGPISKRAVRWEQDCQTWTCQVGALGIRNLPVCVNFSWDILNKHRVCFWHATSRVVDYDQIEEWFRKHLPNVPRTNAMNFHHCINVIKERGDCLYIVEGQYDHPYANECYGDFATIEAARVAAAAVPLHKALERIVIDHDGGREVLRERRPG